MFQPGVLISKSRPRPPLQAVTKALEQLARQGRLREKAFGKQKIYFADQVRRGTPTSTQPKGLGHPHPGRFVDSNWGG